MNILKIIIDAITGLTRKELEYCKKSLEKCKENRSALQFAVYDLQRKLSDAYRKLEVYKKILEPRIDVGKDVVEVTYSEVHKRIRNVYPYVKIFVEDGKHRLVSLQTMKEIISKDWMLFLQQFLKYIYEFFDCDDFSRVFKDFIITKI